MSVNRSLLVCCNPFIWQIQAETYKSVSHVCKLQSLLPLICLCWYSTLLRKQNQTTLQAAAAALYLVLSSQALQ